VGEPKPIQFSPEYWDGIDIADPALVIPELTFPGKLTRAEYFNAREALAVCLSKVAIGNYTETSYPPYNPAALSPQYGEGAVVVVDKEHLIKKIYYPDNRPAWQGRRSKLPASPPIVSPYGQYWLRHQPTAGTGHRPVRFGDEQLISNEEHLIYGRYLLWGVMVNSKKTGPAFASWAFSAPSIHGKRLDIPSQYPTAHPRPAEIGRVNPGHEIRASDFSVRSLERVLAVKLFQPSTRGKKVRALTLRERVQLASRSLERSLAPNPVPAWTGFSTSD
jgi:hypothetical protein